MMDELQAWLTEILPSARYTLAEGEWVESTGQDARRFVVVSGIGGQSPRVKSRRKTFRVVLIGQRNKRSDAELLKEDIEAIMQAVLDYRYVPCGATIITALGEPSGPFFTTENRAYVQLDLMIVF